MQRLAMRVMNRQRGEKGDPSYKAVPQHWLGDAISAIIALQTMSLFLLFTARPVTAALLTLSAGALLLALNYAKFMVLREPLVLVDVWELNLVFRHPHLYLPFLPAKRIIACGAGVMVSVGLLVWLEPALPYLRTWTGGLVLAFLFVAPLLMLLLMRHGRFTFIAAFLLKCCPVSHDAAKDALRNGPLTSAFLHPVLAGLILREELGYLGNPLVRPARSRWTESFEAKLTEIKTLARSNKDNLPHFLVVQGESFSDVRKKFKGEKRAVLSDFLPNWDRLKAKGQTLPTPNGAYGAYTIRSEFTVLTGLHREDLGPWAFNPYLLAAKHRLWSLASFFSHLGYQTVCIHPYDKSFYQRDKVMPNLGFQQFIGIDDLKHLEKFGPYVSDIALAKVVNKLFADSKTPVFCFVITMEAHGPWLQGRLTPKELADALGDLAGCTLFKPKKLLYLAHLKRMDVMLGMLADPVPTKGNPYDRNRSVWMYGDHLPFI